MRPSKAVVMAVGCMGLEWRDSAMAGIENTSDQRNRFFWGGRNIIG